ncbi:dynamin family protein [Exiguobacterium sp. SH0S2]|nr:dynamin family protein [Exiguobacterium sp. SH0S2]
MGIMNEQRMRLAQLTDVFETQDETESARLARTALRKVTRDEIWIAVCGHFSAGKSTLLNNWLGDGVLPTSPIPTSANIVTLRNGDASASVAINDTDWIRLGTDELEHLGDYCKIEEIKEVEYALPRFPFGSDVVLMDTPGIDSTDERHRQATERSLFLADHLFFMMDYNHVQSEQNIQLMKQFSAEARPYSIIINQIDKHDETELPFDAFKRSLETAFMRHAINPDDMFYISLREFDHPENEVERLRTHVQAVIETAREQSEARASLLVDTLLDRSVRSIETALEQLPVVEKQTAEIQSRLQRLEKKSTWLQLFRREFFKHQSPIVASAPIMNYEFRELLRDYLESCAPEFKVGLFFSKEKTRQERVRREDVAAKEFNRLIDTNLRPHLIKYAEDIVRDLKLPEAILSRPDTLPSAPKTLISEQVKAGASLSGDTVLQFSRDIESALAAWVTKVSDPWVTSVETYLEAEGKKRIDQIKAEQDDLYDMLDTRALQRRLAEKQALLSTYAIRDISEDRLGDLETRHYVEAGQLPKKQVEHQQQEVASTSLLGDDVTAFSFDFLYEYAVCEILEKHPLFKSRVKSLRHKLARAESERYTLAIFGAFSSGKSSTLNALLGETVLPTSPNPLTASITKIVPPNGQAHKSASITFKTRDELEAELNGYGASLEALSIDHPFVNAVKNAPLSYLGSEQSVDYDTFCSFVTEEEKSCIVKEIELYVDSPWAERGIIFVDTPGADSQFNRHSEVQFGYMRDADAVLFVTYYNHAFTEADRELVIQLGRVQGTGGHDMFFLVNASDLATDDAERDAVTDYVSNQLTKLGVRNPTVLPISSRNAIQGRDNGFDRFSAKLEQFVDHDLRQANAVRIKDETSALVTAFEDVLREAEADATVKETHRTQLEQLRESDNRLSVTTLVDPFTREVNELLAHLETRSLFRLSDFVKETFHPVEVDGSKASLERALTRTLDKYAYDIHQELQVFQYRLERFLKQETERLIERETLKLRPVLPTLSYEEDIDIDWLRDAVDPVTFEADPFRPVLKHYKNANQFFEADGRTKLRDDLSARLKAAVREQLEAVGAAQAERTASHLQLLETTLSTAWNREVNDLVAGELSVLTDGQSFDDMKQRLDALRKD